ncbi:ABC transporter ATP-binding protein [Brachybacterium fresconis]|uniref:Peptide/nickel transport system ATP-binding protein n=1 Tax=Brachybacterium fresconis TaxID=173363 RepID=A0ABS4YMG4_9MICO|nr:ATP-binding cassette domain-containing protein [Brachybacterium fresconis]MBP2410001.1 peptide/nickel transport system ATP-binding protein [Brachybacterium fresconis]
MSTLTVADLSKTYLLRDGLRFSRLEAVRSVSFELTPGRTVALVGQSGSGKSTIAKLIAQLETPTSGTLSLDGRPVGRRGRALAAYRDQVQMVFQDPFASLNPFHSVGHHLERPLLLHGKATKQTAREKALALLERVNLSPATVFIDRKPHELSGGQRQRVSIARALAPEPSILVADEPVSMLDVSIRLGVLNLLARLQREENLALLYITHDLATARHFSDEILVMYHGDVVEQGAADDVILDPQAEFTKQLLVAAPEPGANPRFLAEARRRGVPMPDHLAALEESP